MIRSEEIRFKMTRNDVEYGEIYADSSPTLRVNGDSEIKRSLQGTFLPYAVDSLGRLQEIDWLFDEIKPILVIDGIEYPLGMFMPASVTPKNDKGKTTLAIEAYDRTWKVRDTKVESRVSFAKSSEYLTAIETLLATCGIARISTTPSDLSFADARDDWETGTSYLKIVNQLLGEINYNPLWFDANGIAIVEPASTPSARYVKHHFTDKKPDLANEKEISLINIYPTISKTTDIYQKPNVFICICSNPDKSSAMVQKVENKNPESPLSIQRRGRKIVSVEKVDNIASNDELKKYANRLLLESMITGEVIEFQTMLQPGFGVNDVCSISFKDLDGLCIEKEWSMQLQPGGTMSHKLERLVLNLE